jgi:hypothetical protein
MSGLGRTLLCKDGNIVINIILVETNVRNNMQTKALMEKNELEIEEIQLIVVGILFTKELR